MTFKVRHESLRAIEGWYDTGSYRFKLSCRYNDLLRCSETKHFTSCFRKNSFHREQPVLRCADPTWAIIYAPDRSGAFLGRALCQLEIRREEPCLRIDKIYGNQLKFEDIEKMLKPIIGCRYSGTDTYLLTGV